MRTWNCIVPLFLWVSAIGSMVPCTQAANYSESTEGDLSNVHTNPTPFALSVGTNVLTATTGLDGDLEYVRADVSVGTRLASLVLQSYSSVRPAAFIGMRIGASIPVDACCATASDLSGYTLFGTGVGNVGQDILPEMGTAFGAMGFTPPLPAGSYTFWIEQTSGDATSYQFKFNIEQLVTPGVVGDYNSDDVVNAADYVVWRKNIGALTLANRDPENSGPVSEADFLSWREHFGRSALGAGAVGSIPEPATCLLLAIAGLAWICRHRKYSNPTH
jgi:hypothetical protein